MQFKLPMQASRWFVGALIAVLVVATFFYFIKWMDTHSGAAAWLQAIGAIAIIFATYRVARQARDFAQDADARARRRHLRAAATAAGWSYASYERLKEAVFIRPVTAQRFLAAYSPTDFQAASQALHGVPLAELDDLVLAQSILTLQSELDRAARRAEAAATAAVTFGGDLPEHIANELANGDVHLFNAKANVERRVREMIAQSQV